jgi:hypothetical protein
MRRAALRHCVHRKLQTKTIGPICRFGMPGKREVVPQDESALKSWLHCEEDRMRKETWCEINDLVQEHVEEHETVDIAEVQRE